MDRMLSGGLSTSGDGVEGGELGCDVRIIPALSSRVSGGPARGPRKSLGMRVLLNGEGNGVRLRLGR